MNNNIKIAFAFVAGVTIGYFVTRKALETKYERIADAEIASVKEVYAKAEKERAEKEEYEARAAEYDTYSKPEETVIEVKEVKSMISLRVISPDEYGDCDYEIVNLTYFSDGVLSYDDGEIVEDVYDCVGDFVAHFGEYDDDTVFIRNDNMRIDYEINRDLKTYRETFCDFTHTGE